MVGEGRYSVGVTAIVRVTLRDGVFHEDIGYGAIENVKSKAAALDKVCRMRPYLPLSAYSLLLALLIRLDTNVVQERSSYRWSQKSFEEFWQPLRKLLIRQGICKGDSKDACRKCVSYSRSTMSPQLLTNDCCSRNSTGHLFTDGPSSKTKPNLQLRRRLQQQQQ